MEVPETYLSRSGPGDRLLARTRSARPVPTVPNHVIKQMFKTYCNLELVSESRRFPPPTPH